MKLLLLVVIGISATVQAGHITHDEKATSYQNIHLEHFHAVPTYIKKEDKHLLEHPIPLGKSSSKVEVHHGGKHDHGYALTDVKSTLHDGHFGYGGFVGGGEAHGFEGGLELGGHDHLQYEASDHGAAELSQHYVAAEAEAAPHTGHEELGLGHYQTEH